MPNKTKEVEHKTTERHWRVIYGESTKPTGRYAGASPYQAANKALTEIIRQKRKDGNSTKGKVSFAMIESTRGKQKKVHYYEGRRVKLTEPVEYEIAPGEILRKEYKNKLHKLTKAELTKSKQFKAISANA